MDKVENPTLLFGNIDTPYMIIFNDVKGNSTLGGGRTLIIGYTYPNGDYGAQLVLNFTGAIKFRQKYNGSWSEFKKINV